MSTLADTWMTDEADGRFVLLKHHWPPGDASGRRTHWDLMFQRSGVLATWALKTLPSPGAAVAARRLADHRLDYLDYEGPVSGSRGMVERVEAGDYAWTDASDDRVAGWLRGASASWQGCFELSRDDAGGVDAWRFAWRLMSAND